MAQNSDSLATKPIDSLPNTEVKTPQWWAFFMDPTYSPTDKVGTVRLSWGWSIHGLDAGWFLDLTWTPDKPADISSAFGKFTVSKSISGIPWTSVAVEYTLNSSASD
jgi:hypothetical protein